eukprot:3206166-Pyramimonas_sp.AAC.1
MARPWATMAAVGECVQSGSDATVRLYNTSMGRYICSQDAKLAAGHVSQGRPFGDGRLVSAACPALSTGYVCLGCRPLCQPRATQHMGATL